MAYWLDYGSVAQKTLVRFSVVTFLDKFVFCAFPHLKATFYCSYKLDNNKSEFHIMNLILNKRKLLVSGLVARRYSEFLVDH